MHLSSASPACTCNPQLCEIWSGGHWYKSYEIRSGAVTGSSKQDTCALCTCLQLHQRAPATHSFVRFDLVDTGQVNRICTLVLSLTTQCTCNPRHCDKQSGVDAGPSKQDACTSCTCLQPYTTMYLQPGAGIAQGLECWTCDWKVTGSNPCRSSRRIFFSRVDFLCWHLFQYLFHPMLLQ